MASQPIDGFPGYIVTDGGSVFGQFGTEIKSHKNKRGYKQVTLGHGKTKRLHRLVAMAFVENPLGLPEVNHVDGDKLNNSASNLEWCTRKQNMEHAFTTGLCKVVSGERSPAAKLKDAEVQEIRSIFKARHPEFGGAALGRRFGVDQSRIHQIMKT